MKHKGNKLVLAILLFTVLLVSSRGLAHQFFNKNQGVSASEGITLISDKNTYQQNEEILLTLNDATTSIEKKVDAVEATDEESESTHSILDEPIIIVLPRDVTYDSVKTAQLNNGFHGVNIKWTAEENKLTIILDQISEKKEVLISLGASKAGSYQIQAGREFEKKQFNSNQLTLIVEKLKETSKDGSIANENSVIENPIEAKVSIEEVTDVPTLRTLTPRVISVVTTWGEFQTALADSTVDTINLGADITRSGTASGFNPGSINRDITINGNAHTINFGSGGTGNNGILLAATTVPTNLVINDANLIKTQTPGTAVFSSTAANSTNWNVVLNNITTPSTNTAAIVTATNADLTITGKNTIYQTANTVLFTYRNLVLSGENNLNYRGAVLFAGSGTISVNGTNTITGTTGNMFVGNGTALVKGDNTFASTSGTILNSGTGAIALVGTNTISTGGTARILAGGDISIDSINGTTKLENATGALVTSTGKIDVKGSTEFKTTSGAVFTSSGNGAVTLADDTIITSTSGNIVTNGTGAITLTGTNTINTGTGRGLFGGPISISGVNKIENSGTSTTIPLITSTGSLEIKGKNEFKTARSALATSAGTIDVEGDNIFNTTTGAVFTSVDAITVAGKNIITNTTGNTFIASGTRTTTSDITLSGETSVTATGENVIFTNTGNVNLTGTNTFNTAGAVTTTTNDFTILNGSLDFQSSASSAININGVFTVDNSTVDFSTTNTSGTAIDSQDVLITNKSVVKGDVIYAGFGTRAAGSKFIVNGGSTMNLFSRNYIAILFRAENSTFTVSGEGTVVNVSGTTSVIADWGAVIVVNGANSEVNVLDHAELRVDALNISSSAMTLESDGGRFNVDNRSKLILSQKTSGTYERGSVLRFRLRGNMIFNVTNNSLIKLTSNGGSAAGLRLFGGNNTVNISSGSHLDIENAGTGSPLDPGGQDRNQAIMYDGGTNPVNSFNLIGKDSEVNLNSPYGAAIDNNSGGMVIVAGEGTVFEAVGRTLSANRAIFNSPRADIKVTNPLYYDFQNRRVGGGNVFAATNAVSVFESTNSDLSIWKNGTNVDGNPFRAWTIIDYALTGANFISIKSTNVPTEFNTSATSYGNAGMSSYTRMSGNNARAVVDELRMPTNADQTIYGHAGVPEGSSGIRDAWTDEVFVTIRHTKVDGSISNYVAKTTGIDSTSTGLQIWGEAGRGGMFSFKLPNNEFLKTGETLEVTQAIRGGADPNSARVHVSLPEDLIAPKQTVVDTTPPEVAVITDKANITDKTRVYQGTGGEPGALVTATNNDQPIYEADGVTLVQNTVDAQGNWTLTFPSDFTSGDVIRVYLSDHAGQATLEASEVKQPSWNATGNINPREAYSFHDLTFAAATKVNILELEPKVEFEKTALSSTTGAVTDRIVAGQSMKYRLTVKNIIQDSKINNLVITDNLDAAFESATNGTIKDSQGDSIGTVTYVAGKITATATKQMLYNDVYTIEFDVKVKAGTALGSKILNTASLTALSGNSTPVAATSTQTETTVVEGVLKLIEAPVSVDFGKQQISSVDKVYTPESDIDFKVDDTRTNLKNWSLAAKLLDIDNSAELDGSLKLPNSLVFKNNNNSVALGRDAIPVRVSDKTAQDGITQFGWKPDDDDGLRLNVHAGDALAKEYKWKIEWSLVDAP
ncbi:pectate lyase-like adhesive domain-containing protein [Carnobacterium gallinarum]|uniref:pectate lyase-like adhesive domain-containing protein n=1 Tax=Carnobacterium gallinarum TaxID=2749 RepID=UPI0005524AF4|nr:pectate lyase-like adhesive domain-containing protein [Carnobacterium gallinarum]